MGEWGCLKTIVKTQSLSHHSWYTECRVHVQTPVCIMILFLFSEQSGQICLWVASDHTTARSEISISA